MEYLDLSPITAVQGSVTLPGSKSISNRTLLLAALAKGSTRIFGLLDSDDTRVMLAALENLGVAIHKSAQHVEIEGCAGRFKTPKASLFLGNAGTAVRPLTAALAMMGGDYQLSGVPRMHERPIGDLVDALNVLGCKIDYVGVTGYPPLHIRAAPTFAADVTQTLAIKTQIRGDVSSQFLTALLMAAPLAQKQFEIEVIGELISKPYIEITLNLMQRFGVQVQREGWKKFTISAGSHYISPSTIEVEGDASSASYFLAAGALSNLGKTTTGAPFKVIGAGKNSIQGDIKFAESLQQMGARIEMGDNWISVQAPELSKGKLKAIDADFNHIPDAAMTIAVLALFADGTSTLRNIASWRVKETDRLFAMATELRKLGATVEEGADYLRITPPSVWRSAAIDTYDDHRMAMCFSLAAFGGVSVRINEPNCVAKTFPDYFSMFKSITA